MPSKALGSRRSRAARGGNGDTLSLLPPLQPIQNALLRAWCRFPLALREGQSGARQHGMGWDMGQRSSLALGRAANKHTAKARGQETKSSPRMFLTQTLA